MTIKEKLETIKGKKIAIWCFDEWQTIIIHKYLDRTTSRNYWNMHGRATCYDFNNNEYLMYCNYEYYQANGYEVILFKDFFNGFDLSNEINIELTQQDINAILNEKYGKDNWVIK